jgi:CRISPR-associated endonuclease/helicase Cas3
MTLPAFPDFFEAVHGVRPFAWQSALAEQVHDTGSWPEQLDIPTGCGKTATLDIATWLLGHETLGGGLAHPRRVFFVVDRRVVVDAAYERARAITTALALAESGPVLQVANALRQRAGAPSGGSTPPLRAVRLRGATGREPDWARSAAEPLLVISTVDQVGSRLMFRGYGVTRARRPVHAGLVGMDALLLLDEAHLARPFLQTARELARVNQAAETSALGVHPLRLVTLSATPGEAGPKDARHVTESVWTDPQLSARLESPKHARLVDIKVRADGQRQLVEALIGALDSTRSELAPSTSPLAAALVVNRVDTARAVFDALCDRGEPGHVCLLIGPSRPLDRDAVTREVLSRVASSRRSNDPLLTEPVIVVATQCVEAGADLDFDVLITQSAPLDALRQRFGRLDRLGRHAADPTPRAAIVHPLAKDPDPIYGSAIAKTMAWLRSRATDDVVPFGLAQMSRMLRDDTAMDLSSMLAPKAHAPLLHPGIIDLLTETSELVEPDVDVSVFLHGPLGTPQVSIAWRESADLMQFERLPLTSLECLSLPLWRARRLLSEGGGREGMAFVDFDGVDSAEPEPARGAPSSASKVPYLIVRNGEPIVGQSPVKVIAGDIIVLPTNAGGCDRYGLTGLVSSADRAQAARVTDHSELAGFLSHRWVSLMVSPTRVIEWLGPGGSTAWFALSKVVEDDPAGAIEGLLARLRSVDRVSESTTAAAAILAIMRERTSVLQVTQLNDALLLQLPPNTSFNQAELCAWIAQLNGNAYEGDDAGGVPVCGLWTQSDGSVESGEPVTLDCHVADVQALTAAVTNACSSSRVIADVLDHAARLHDHGKRDRRFQAMLRGVSRLSRFDAGPTLAKSGRRGVRGEGKRAGLPELWRHEVHSVLAAGDDPFVAGLEEGDRELLLWLIATHHGGGRSFFPFIEGGEPRDAEQNAIGVDQAARGARLSSRYGPHGLAWMEAVLRLADCTASASRGM